MLGIKYFKAEPTEFARIRVGVNVKKEGEGISGFYMPFRSTIEIISLSDSSLYLSIDSLKFVKLREGAKVRVKIGKPLRVIKLK